MAKAEITVYLALEYPGHWTEAERDRERQHHERMAELARDGIADPGVAAAARQARRVEQATAPAAVVLAESLAELAGEHLGAEWHSINGVPTAFEVVDSGGTGGPTLIVHVLDVGR